KSTGRARSMCPTDSRVNPKRRPASAGRFRVPTGLLLGGLLLGFRHLPQRVGLARGGLLDPGDRGGDGGLLAGGGRRRRRGEDALAGGGHHERRLTGALAVLVVQRVEEPDLRAAAEDELALLVLGPDVEL